MQPHQLRHNNIVISIIFGALFLPVASAYGRDGSISPQDRYAWGTIGGWTNFAPVNGNVVVSDTGITGYAWSANHGWINLAPTNGGVRNDGQGNLSGFAWDTADGWISFEGVSIDASGVFHGQATGVAADGGNNIITFDCTHCRVVTTWRASVAADNISQQNPNSANRQSHAAQRAVTPPPIRTSPVEPPPQQAVPGTYPQSQAGRREGVRIGDDNTVIGGEDVPPPSSGIVRLSKDMKAPTGASTDPNATSSTSHRSDRLTVFAIIGSIMLILLFALLVCLIL